jgi:hypothetical protein
MKKTVLFLLLILITIVSITAQTEEELVLKIREQFKTTNTNLDTYLQVQKDIYSESVEGGTMTLYQTNNETVLMHCEFYGEGGNIKEDFYYWNDELYFVYTVREGYDRASYLTGSQVVETVENRYYFNNGKMIRWLDKTKQKVDNRSDAFRNAETEVLNESVRLMDVFNNAE